MITNADITIYNYWYNPEKKEREYRRTQICGVHWYTEQKIVVAASMAGKGVVSADIYKIRIPKDAKIQDGRQYLDAKQYHMLDADNVDKYWTVDHDDLFVKGLVDEDVTSLASLQAYSEAGKINSFSVNDYGTSPHIRIGGVA